MFLMAEFCCVPGCFSVAQQERDRELKFYRFPRDAKLAHKWQSKLKFFKCSTSARVCSIHFTEKDYMLTNLGWKILLPDAVPSLCLPNHNVIPVCRQSSSKTLLKKQGMNVADAPVSGSEGADCRKYSAHHVERKPVSKASLQNTSKISHLDQARLELIFDELKGQSALRVLKLNRHAEKSLEMEKADFTSSPSYGDLNCGSPDMCVNIRFSGGFSNHDNSCKIDHASKTVQNSSSSLPSCSLWNQAEKSGNFSLSDAQMGSSSLDNIPSNGTSNSEYCKVFHCYLCNAKISSKRLVKEHLLAHEIWSCYICFKGFRSKDKLVNHHIKVHGGSAKLLYCSYCAASFKSYTVYSSHLNMHIDEKMAYCKICGRPLHSSGISMTHPLTHIIEARLKCEPCEKSFVSVELFEAHKILHSDLSHIPGELSDEANLFQDIKLHHEMFCCLCDMTCRTMQSWRKHIQSHFDHKELEDPNGGVFFWKNEDTPFPNLETSICSTERDPNEGNHASSKQANLTLPSLNEGFQCKTEPENEATSSCLNLKVETYEEDTDQHASDVRNNGFNQDFSQGCEDITEDYKPLESNSKHNDDNDEFSCIECGERCGSSSRLALHYENHVKEEPNDNWSSDDETVT